MLEVSDSSLAAAGERTSGASVPRAAMPDMRIACAPPVGMARGCSVATHHRVRIVAERRQNLLDVVVYRGVMHDLCSRFTLYVCS